LQVIVLCVSLLSLSSSNFINDNLPKKDCDACDSRQQREQGDWIDHPTAAFQIVSVSHFQLIWVDLYTKKRLCTKKRERGNLKFDEL
jgi:hypothetical protein